jgi:hypothetical protein
LVTSNPRPGDHVGSAEESWFVVEDGFVILTDAAGVPLSGEDRRAIEGDALATARRMLRARLSRKLHSDFRRRLIYRDTGII